MGTLQEIWAVSRRRVTAEARKGDVSKRSRKAGCVVIVCDIKCGKSETHWNNVYILRVYLLFQLLTFTACLNYFIGTQT
jgi:hypothetical protein